MTPSATLPSQARLNPVRPCVVITMRSAPVDVAISVMVWTAAPVGWSTDTGIVTSDRSSRALSSRYRNSVAERAMFHGASGYPAYRTGSWTSTSRISEAPCALAIATAAGNACSASSDMSSGTRSFIGIMGPLNSETP